MGDRASSVSTAQLMEENQGMIRGGLGSPTSSLVTKGP